MMTRPGQLTATDKASLDAILTASPELAAVAASVHAFAAMMTERRGRELLEPWITTALATGEPALRSFVTGCAPIRTPSPTASACPGALVPLKATSTDWQRVVFG
jgi:hypothetical protein